MAMRRITILASLLLRSLSGAAIADQNDDSDLTRCFFKHDASACKTLGKNFSKSIALVPGDETAWNDRGAVYSYLKQYDRVIADEARGFSPPTDKPQRRALLRPSLPRP